MLMVAWLCELFVEMDRSWTAWMVSSISYVTNFHRLELGNNGLY